MKKLIIFYSILFIGLQSCNKNITNEVTDFKSNFGEEHNKYVEYIYNNVDLTVETKEDLQKFTDVSINVLSEKIGLDYGLSDSEIKEVKLQTSKLINNYFVSEGNFILENNKANLHKYIKENTSSLEFEYILSIIHLSEQNINPENIISEIEFIELKINTDIKLDNNSKQKLIQMTSVAKNSALYWGNYYSYWDNKFSGSEEVDNNNVAFKNITPNIIPPVPNCPGGGTWQTPNCDWWQIFNTTYEADFYGFVGTVILGVVTTGTPVGAAAAVQGTAVSSAVTTVFMVLRCTGGGCQ